MAKGNEDAGVERFVEAVAGRVGERVATLEMMLGERGLGPMLAPGKMLRTRLAAHLAGAEFLAGTGDGERRVGDCTGMMDVSRRAGLVTACAALELIHTASLCHDDVIDNALIRRRMPTLWRARGQSAAILIGDILLCEAISLVAGIGDAGMLAGFLGKIQETCRAEAEHEVRLRGSVLDAGTYLRIARGKTGPFFAFAAGLGADGDAELGAALEEAGYALGAAYQLADDVLDARDDGGRSGKTLGTDGVRGKDTLPQRGADGVAAARGMVEEECRRASAVLARWPVYRARLDAFLEREFRAVLQKMIEG